MTFRDLQALVNKTKSNLAEVKSIQMFALGMGVAVAIGVAGGIILATKWGKKMQIRLSQNAENTIETMKDTFELQAAIIKNSAAQAEREVQNIIKDVNEKTEGVNKDISDGYHKVTQDIHKTVENISKELNKSEK